MRQRKVEFGSDGIPAEHLLMRQLRWTWADVMETPNRVVLEMRALLELENELRQIAR